MKSIPATDFGRGARAVIDLQALRHNLQTVRSRVGESRVMAVVKANAYGHGLEQAAAALQAADAYCVATVAEAARVRNVCPDHPILLLEGVMHPRDLELAEQLGLWIAVHSPTQLELLAQATPQRPLRTWLKIDTGMHRLGFAPSQAAEALARLRQLPAVDDDVVLMSHLANADDLDDPMTNRQLECFRGLQRELGLTEASLANSAGALGWEATRYDWVRAGLALYGASPLLAHDAAALDLRAAMTLESTLIAVNRAEAGAAVGYGGAWRCERDTTIGVVGIGYGDGYPRHADSGTPVWVGERTVPIAGRVSMDMSCVDLGPDSSAAVGDRVELWGSRIAVDTVAEWAGTIAYELLCGVTARVPTVYVDSA